MEKRVFSKLLASAALLIGAALIPAQAGIISVKASDVTTISTVGSFGAENGRLKNELYMLSESQGAPWLSYGLLKFDLSNIASSSNLSDGEFKLSVASIWPGSIITAYYSLHTLVKAYHQDTVSYNNYGGFGQQIDTDSDTFNSANGQVNGELTFKLSQSLLQSWVADPSSNHGLLLRYTSYTSNKIHSDMTFAPNGNKAPTLTFTVAEPAGLFLPLCAFALALLRRRHIKQ